jgi:outer membrane lipoprotein carrier protein
MVFLATQVARAGGVADVRSTAEAVDQLYNHLQTLQATFEEIYRGNGMERIESGVLWLKKPGKMRWEYRSPKEKLFLSDGRDVWFYVPGDHQARKTPVRKLDDLRSPLRMLLGKTHLEKELQGLSFAPDVAPWRPGDQVLRGVPKSLGEQISQVLVEVTPGHEIGRMLLEATDGSVTEYRFDDQKRDVPVSDERFRFAPPPGTEVIDGDFGQ